MIFTIEIQDADAALIWNDTRRGGRRQVCMRVFIEHMLRDRAHEIRRAMDRTLLFRDEQAILTRFLRGNADLERGAKVS